MQIIEHPNRTKTRSNWDDLRVFIAVVETGSFRKAAEKLMMSINSVRSKMDNLEQYYDATLIHRRATGVERTEEGRRVYSIAVDMMHQYNALQRLGALATNNQAGTVRVGVTEGLGTFWMMPRAIEFRNENPDIRLDLRCEMRVQDISQLEVDVAIQLEEPSDHDMIISRLGYLHMMLFASSAYVARHQEPWAPEDISKFDFVALEASQALSMSHVSEADLTGPELQAKRVAQSIKPENVTIQTNNSSSHAHAIINGGGIGALPTYARAITNKIRPVLHDCHLSRDIWMVIRPDVRRLERVQRAVDWIKTCFNPIEYPWFRKEFMPPSDIVEFMKNKDKTISLFPSLYDDLTGT